MREKKIDRLATYGSLAPGRVNHHQLANLGGRWLKGSVKGRLVQAGWGADLGYPGMHPDPNGEEIDVFIFESSQLSDHWSRLDAFEGEGYVRTEVRAHTDEGEVDAFIYCLSGEA